MLATIVNSCSWLNGKAQWLMVFFPHLTASRNSCHIRRSFLELPSLPKDALSGLKND